MSAGAPHQHGNPLRSTFARRGVLFGALALGGVAAARWFNLGADLTGSALSVRDAHKLALTGEVALIDIRRPDEWATTGIGQGAIPLDMRDTDFAGKLLRHVPNQDAPIALICARGVRSRGLARKLSEAGFTNIIDVPEGMLGSGAGPGWLAAGLPTTPPVTQP